MVNRQMKGNVVKVSDHCLILYKEKDPQELVPNVAWRRALKKIIS